MFEKLDNRYFFTGELVLLNEMHIGSGKGDEKTDALVIKDYRGKPFIPGSSLRGVLRSTIERIAETIGLKPCLLIDNRLCVTTSNTMQDKFKKIMEDKDIAEIEKFIKDDTQVCPVCQVFGSTIIASKIRVTDLLPVSDVKTPAVRDGVAIDRDTETAKKGAKYDFQTVATDTKFKLEIVCENLVDRDIALLAVGIQELVNGNFWLGGNSARGLGRCKLENPCIKYFKGADALKKYLLEGKLEELKVDDFFKYVSILGGSHAEEIAQ